MSSSKRQILPSSSATPDAKRFEMESNAQAKEQLAERISYFYEEMQAELGNLIHLEQEAVRRKYVAMFDTLILQTDLQIVMDRIADRQKLDDFEFRVKEWEDLEHVIKQDLVKLQKMLLGEFAEEEEDDDDVAAADVEDEEDNDN